RFDDSLPFFEDWDFWIQVSRHTTLVHVPEMGGAYRLPGGSALYDRHSSASVRGIEAVVSKWSRRWAAEDLSRLWNAARSELSPGMRKERESELSRLRT